MADSLRVGVLVAILLLAGGGALLGGEEGSADLELLRIKHKLVKLFPDGYPDVYRELAEDVGAAAEGDDGKEAVGLHCTVLMEYGGRLKDGGKVEEAWGCFEKVHAYGVGDALYKKASLETAIIAEARARKPGPDKEKLEQFELARTRFVHADDSAGVTRMDDAITKILAAKGIEAFRNKQYAVAHKLLGDLSRKVDLKSGTDAGDAWAFVRDKTAVITVKTIDVQAEGASVTQGARVRLIPSSGGESKDTTFFQELRWTVGEYKYAVFTTGSEPVLTLPLTLSTSGGGVEVPSRVPSGMAYVPAGGGVSRPFFIDKNEVTVADFKRFNQSYDPEYDGGRLPASEVSFEDAKRYASSKRKQLPTRAQWIRAAFGDSGRRYPWGDGGPNRSNCNISAGEPLPVGGRPTGASPYGVMDMAGNVWEWLEDGSALGGSFDSNKLESTLGGRRFQYLRDPRPGEAKYRSLSGAEQRTYDPYKLTREDENLIEVGLRCVITL